MKLDNDTIKFINRVVTTAQLVNIDDIIIETDCIRAIDEHKSVIILQKQDIPELPFSAIGLNRVATFQGRYDIAKTQDKFAIDAVLDDNDEFVRSLVMKGKGVKIDYRCANPTTINAPSALKDIAHHQVHLNADAVLLFQKGLGAMGSEHVTIISNEDGVSFEFADNNADVFSHQFADSAKALSEDADDMFAFKYSAKTLSALFKHDPVGTFAIGKSGTLSMNINDLNITVLPRV